MAPTTFVARFRDSVNAMILNSFTSEHFTNIDICRIFRSQKQGGTFITTLLDNNTVYVGPPIERTPTAEIEGMSVSLPDSGDLNGRDLALFDAIIVIKSRGLLEEPVKFVNLNEEQLKKLGTYETIEVIEDDGKYIII